MLPRQFRRLLETLQFELVSIRKAIQDQERAIREASNAEQERTKLPPPQPVIYSKLHLPENVNNEIEAYSKQAKSHRISKSIARVLTLLAAVLAACFTGYQSWQAHLQTDQIYHQSEIDNAGASHRAVEVDRQIRLAQQQADTAILTLQTTEGGRILVNSGERKATVLANTPVVDTLQFSNSGKTAITHFRMRVVVKLMRSAKGIGEYRPEETTHGAIGSIPPGGSFSLPIYGYVKKPEHLFFTQEDADAFERGELFSVTYGEFRYCDIFNVPRDVKFCSYAGKQMPMANGRKLQFWPCAAYNYTDNNTKADDSCKKPIDPNQLPNM